jgi:transcription antitermination factor NusG
MLEEGAKHLGLDECLDRVIVLASYKEDGLFYGGDLSGYALIRCRLVSKLYYLLSAIPQVYGMLESPNRRKKGYTPIQELMNEVPDEEVYRLIEGMMKKRKFWLEEGKEVLIKDGAFKGFKGVVISCVDTKVVLEIPIMGRTVKTTTTLDNLVKS